MPGLIHEHQYESDKAAICAANQSAEDVFDAIEWALVRSDLSTLPIIESSASKSTRYLASQATARVPAILVILGEEVADGETKLVLLAARAIEHTAADF